VIKRYFLVLSLLLYSFPSHASFWSKIWDGICNIGQDGITESGSYFNTDTQKVEIKKDEDFLSNALCPPWNKNGGRPNTCLQQFSFPGRFIGFYLNSCAESTLESTYFEPKIKVRTQSCNAAACWSQSTTLSWDGECVIWPGAYALPLLRICARVAVPAVPGDPTDKLRLIGTPADPGYTEGVHLNQIGETQPDKSPLGYDNNPITMTRPKLCAYSDPGLVNLVSATGVHTDLLDWNPINQALHQTTKLHPIAEILKFLVEFNSGATQVQIIGQLLDVIGEKVPGVGVMKSVLSAASKVLEYFNAPAIFIINQFGSLNRDVDSMGQGASAQSMGCVELPMGPYPPPYCKKLGIFIPTPTTENICSNKTNGSLADSTPDNKCVIPLANVTNNLINNSVRITLNNFVPLCAPGVDPTSPATDKCVRINNNLGATDIHTNHRDVIPSCATAASGPCVANKIPLNCGTPGKATCKEEFRVVYVPAIGTPPVSTDATTTVKPITAASPKGETAAPSNYFVLDGNLPDCRLTSTNCQRVWGVNIGDYTDVSLTFTDPDNGYDLSKTVALGVISKEDQTGTDSRKFTATIVRSPKPIKRISTSKSTDNDFFMQQPADICVFEGAILGDNLVGCQARDPLEVVSIINSDNTDVINNYFSPQFVAIVKSRDGKLTVKTPVKPLSIQDYPSKTKPTTINLIGYNFSSFVAYMPEAPTTDDPYSFQPFSGSKALTPLSVYGTYKDTVPTLLTDITSAEEITNYITSVLRDKGYTGGKYLTGLEYINGFYIVGGTHACLDPISITHCPLDITNCVLTKLAESNVTDCKTFKEKQQTIPNLRACTKDDDLEGSGCVPEKVPDTGESGITIYKCLNNLNCYVRNGTNKDNKYKEICTVTLDKDSRIIPSPDRGKVLNKGQVLKVNEDYYDPNIVSSSSNKPQLVVTNADIIDCNTFAYLLSKYKFTDTATSKTSDLRLCTPKDDTKSGCKDEQVTDIIDCTIFAYARSKIPNLGLCTPKDDIKNGCTIEQIESINGGSGITIHKCTNMNCYENNVKPGEEVCKYVSNSGEINNSGRGITIHKCTNMNCYENNVKPGEEVCKYSNNNTTTTYTPSTEVVRDKTPEELGLCLAITQPECAEIKEATTDTGNATWPAAKIGEISKGVCLPGYNAIDQSKLQRYCIANAKDSTVAFDTLDKDVGCKTGDIEFSCDHNFIKLFQPNIRYSSFTSSDDTKYFEFNQGSAGRNNDFPVPEGKYYSNLTFNLSKDSLASFRLGSIAYDDYVLVNVNGKRAYSGPGNFNILTISYFGGSARAYYNLNGASTYGYENGTWVVTGRDIELDLLPYLQDGPNTISITLVTIGTGGLYYSIKYKFK